jgi:hypothetical protein
MLVDATTVGVHDRFWSRTRAEVAGVAHPIAVAVAIAIPIAVSITIPVAVPIPVAVSVAIPVAVTIAIPVAVTIAIPSARTAAVGLRRFADHGGTLHRVDQVVVLEEPRDHDHTGEIVSVAFPRDVARAELLDAAAVGVDDGIRRGAGTEVVAVEDAVIVRIGTRDAAVLVDVRDLIGGRIRTFIDVVEDAVAVRVRAAVVVDLGPLRSVRTKIVFVRHAVAVGVNGDAATASPDATIVVPARAEVERYQK